MGYNLIIRPEAQKEIDEAIFWYNEIREGLELDFFNEMSDVLNYIQKYPKHFQKRYKKIRIRFTKKFDYGIHYIVEENLVVVIAVIHVKRKPKY